MGNIRFRYAKDIAVQVVEPDRNISGDFQMLFLIGAGVSGGAGFVETLRREGVILFVYGAIMTLVPMFVGFFVAKKVLKLRLLSSRVR